MQNVLTLSERIEALKPIIGFHPEWLNPNHTITEPAVRITPEYLEQQIRKIIKRQRG